MVKKLELQFDIKAALLALSAFLVTFGGAIALIPDVLPAEYVVPVTVIAWIFAAIGVSISAALKEVEVPDPVPLVE